MTDREKAIVMAYTGVAMLTGDKLDEYYKYCSELLGHPAYTHEVFSNDISERAKNDFIKLCKEEDEYRWHDLIKDPEDLPKKSGSYFIAYRSTQGIIKNAYYTVEYFYRSNKGKIAEWHAPSYVTVVAWKEFEPFGGEDDAEIH